MGKARIVTNVGGGLYRATPLYDTAALDAAIAKIDAAEAEHFGLLNLALKSLASLRDEKQASLDAMNAVILQWQQGLIKALEDSPPPLVPPTPNDPDTGLPWADPRAAQEKALLDAIAAARSTAGIGSLSRSLLLDKACVTLMEDQSSSKGTGHFGSDRSTPENRVYFAGYSAATVGETIGYGYTLAASLLAVWLADSAQRAVVLGADWTAIGIAYRYAPAHPATHLWCAVYAVPGTPPGGVGTVAKPEPDPAKDAGEETAATLQKISPPALPDKLMPKKLPEIAAKFAEVSAKVKAAENEVSRLSAEKIARGRKKDDLTALRADRTIDVWACYYIETLAPGDVVYTAEVPGYWIEASQGGSAIINPNTTSQQTVTYVERAWNIVRRYTGMDSQLRHAEVMSPEMTFYDLAMEPGHLKWRPAWRYGVITAMAGDFCSVTISAASDRYVNSGVGLGLGSVHSINAQPDFIGVPIEYPTCNGLVFTVGDEVLLRFDSQDRAAPRVVGFRRVPRPCGISRIYWGQIV
jgi:uncharacterized protein YkwD